MINVAFLLLIFFMMVAVFVPPEPFVVTPPDGAFAPQTEKAEVILIDKNGTLARGELVGDAVFRGLSGQDIMLRADARLEAALLARIASRVKEAGAASISVAVQPRVE